MAKVQAYVAQGATTALAPSGITRREMARHYLKLNIK
jgi:hypothetical protein